MFAERKIAADQLSPLRRTCWRSTKQLKRTEPSESASSLARASCSTRLMFCSVTCGSAPALRRAIAASSWSASLIASGQIVQLTGHLNIGMNNGLTQTEIAEAITHLAFYVGWPNVFLAAGAISRCKSGLVGP
jgi:4-carboxymuconolactone decarboxylase